MDDLTAKAEQLAKTATAGTVLKILAGAMDSVIARFRQTDERVAKVERRLAEAESKGFRIPYRGTWKAATEYQAGAFVTHAGGLWHANEDTDTRPGSGPHWTLAVKSGRIE
jgi:hypothetical protein